MASYRVSLLIDAGDPILSRLVAEQRRSGGRNRSARLRELVQLGLAAEQAGLACRVDQNQLVLLAPVGGLSPSLAATGPVPVSPPPVAPGAMGPATVASVKQGPVPPASDAAPEWQGPVAKTPTPEAAESPALDNHDPEALSFLSDLSRI